MAFDCELARKELCGSSPQCTAALDAMYDDKRIACMCGCAGTPTLTYSGPQVSVRVVGDGTNTVDPSDCRSYDAEVYNAHHSGRISVHIPDVTSACEARNINPDVSMQPLSRKPYRPQKVHMSGRPFPTAQDVAGFNLRPVLHDNISV
jgi:hypothetical protein